MSNMTKLVERIQSLSINKVVRDDLVKEQFITVYNSVWQSGGEAVYEREANYIQKLLREKPDLQDCTSLSMYFAFIDLAVQGLSLEPGTQAQCYLLTRNYKCAGPQGQEVWEKRCTLTISGFGELYLRRRAGQILYADNPVIVYACDSFEFGERDGRKYVNYTMRLPRTDNKIVACFLKITRTDGTVDYSVMTEQDWLRLAQYSAGQNTRYNPKTGQREHVANALYNSNAGQIDTGFLVAKCVRHAFKTYPKLPIGKGSQLESEKPMMPEEEFNPYGIEAPEEQSFAPQPDMSGGVQIAPAESEEDCF